jgi:hypothetical protein
MAYDRYDPREEPRGERWRSRDERHERHYRGRDDDRGFFERAGDEIASWFGDEEADRRRREDQRMQSRGSFDRDRDFRRERGRDDDRQWFGGRASYRGYGGGEGEYRGSTSGTETVGAPGLERGYRPMFGGYTVSEGSGYPRDSRLRDWEAGDSGERGFPSRHDPHYEALRRRHLDDLDRDYEEFRRENQARFDTEFGSWRERRMQKRGLLGQIREHMEVVGSDDQRVGTVDRVVGDRIILTKSDPESGGAHHSISCADIASVEGDRVMLDCSADQARERWRDESRSRALFEREDQGEMGDRVLNRSFEGTYR